MTFLKNSLLLDPTKGGLYMKWWQECLEVLFTNLAELLKVKTLITLMTFGSATYMFVKGALPIEVYAPLITMVATFYFQRKEKI